MSAGLVIIRSRQGKLHRLALTDIAWLRRPCPGSAVDVVLIDGQTLELVGMDAERVWALFTPEASQTPSPDRAW